MKLNSRTFLNLALLLVVAVLVTVVWLEPGLQEEATGKPLMALTSQQPQQLRLSNEQGEVVLQRDGEAWSLQAPLVIAANQFRVEQLLHWFGVVSVQSYAAAGLALAKFGLDRPQATLSTEGVELRFGNLDPLNHRRYLLLNGVVHLVDESELTAVDAPWNYFVSPQLIAPGAKIKALTIPGLGEISQDDKGWHYSGATPPASADAMQMLVDGWRSATALSVEPVVPTEEGEKVMITFADDHPPLLLTLV
ncbi:MAG: hypothetical protein U1B30_14530, partial [Pseudomonadota bacterium]|nr:hypothetical protein [Pseudomonadota bacterium]